MFFRLCSRAPWMTSLSEPTEPSVPAGRDTPGRGRESQAGPGRLSFAHGEGSAHVAAVPGGRGALPEGLRAGVRAGDGALGPAALPRRTMGGVHGVGLGEARGDTEDEDLPGGGAAQAGAASRRRRQGGLVGPGARCRPSVVAGRTPTQLPVRSRARRAGCSSSCCPSTVSAKPSRSGDRGHRARSTPGRPTDRGSWSRTAGMHADGAGADGSGAARVGERTCPTGSRRWTPGKTGRSGVASGCVEVASGEVRALSRDGLNVWEAEWCGDGAVVAVASEDPGESAWYGAPLVLIDASTGDDRVLATSDVQFGLPVGALDGSRVAAVEAPCSDRQLVSGRAVVIDVSSGERRTIEIEDADITWLGWRANGSLAYAALRRGDTVFGEIDPETGDRHRGVVDERERRRMGALRRGVRCGRVRVRPARVRPSARGRRRRSGGGSHGGLVPARRPRSRSRSRRASRAAHMDRARRRRDRRLPPGARRRGAASADPVRARRAGLVLRRSGSRGRISPGSCRAGSRS